MRRIASFLVIGVISLFSSVHAEQTIRVYAAASMTNVISELSAQYQKQNGVKIIPVYAGSSSLARQIEQGAPADLFISANKKWMEYLVKKETVEPKRIVQLAENELVLIAPESEPVPAFNLSSRDSWLSLLKSSRLAIGQPESVPAGIYAKQSLSALGVWQDVRLRTAPTSSVRIALALVERGEALLGVVYKTDALVNPKVVIVDRFTSDLHDPIVYPAALISERSVAADFLSYLQSESAKQVFVRYGFK